MIGVFAELCEIEFQREAKNLIGGQKYVVVMTILKHATERALQSRNLRLFGINTIFVFVFESQTLSYKSNPISCEKISQTFVSNTEKIARLIGEEIRYADYLIISFLDQIRINETQS